MIGDGDASTGVNTFSCRAQAALRRSVHGKGARLRHSAGTGTGPLPADPGTEPPLGLILLILLVMLLFGGLPRWQYSKNWGYGPSGFLGIAMAVVLVLVLLGHIPRGF